MTTSRSDRRLGRTVAGAFALAFAAAGLAACNNASDPAADTCAGVDQHLLTAIVGTSDYTTAETGTFPVQPVAQPQPYECRVTVDGDDILDIDSGVPTDAGKPLDREADTYWAFARGEGYVTESMATWTCGAVMISASVPTDVEATRAEMVGLLSALAERAECFTRDQLAG